jgi:enoyl-CoA hydratase/carnithine racemase
MARATAALEALAMPVVAVIEGLCIGAGVAIALACDLRFAAADARFAITPAKLGVFYSLADSKRLADAVGLSRAKDLLFSGRMLSAQQAAAIGLIDELFDPTTLEREVAERLTLMTAASPWSIARAKAVLRLIAEGASAETDETRGWFADAPEGADYREGIAAFRAKRKPVFARA